MESKFYWLLDNGHGKSTPGKRSPVFEDKSQLFEYEFNRDIVGKIAKKLNNLKIYNHIIVPEIEDISLDERVTRANNFETPIKKIFLSIHANAHLDGSDWTPAHGIESYFFRPYSQSERLAQIFQSELITHTGLKDRGTKQANFYVLKYTKMLAVLTENGFYTNRIECEKLLNQKWREAIADAHVSAIQAIEKMGYNI